MDVKIRVGSAVLVLGLCLPCPALRAKDFSALSVGAGAFASYVYDDDTCMQTQENVYRTLIQTGLPTAVLGAVGMAIWGGVRWKHPGLGALIGFNAGAAIGVLGNPAAMRMVLKSLPSERLRDMQLCKAGVRAKEQVEPIYENFKARAPVCVAGLLNEVDAYAIEDCWQRHPAIHDQIRDLLQAIYSVNNAACLSAKSIWENYNRISLKNALASRNGSYMPNQSFDCDGESLEDKFSYAFP